MPQHGSVESLHSVCLRFISKNVIYWTEHYEDYYLGQAVYRYVLGPFNQLNSRLADDLLTLLVKEQRLSRSALHLLLYGGALQNADLSSCNRIVNDEVVEILTLSCKRLQTLDLSYCKRITSRGFISIATSLPQLSSLNVTKTNLKSCAAQTIFRHCCGLQKLSLKHCQINDQDLEVLCCDSGTKIRHLDISYTLVTERGVRALLRGLPQLQILEYPSILTCLFDESGNSGSCLESYKLRSLRCQDFMEVSNGMLRAIPHLCPNVSQLDLKFAGGFNNAGVCHLAQLKNLVDLQLCCEESEDITFADGVMPVLLEIGQNLKVLSLQDIDGLEPTAVCRLCPNLRKLVLFMMKDGKLFSSFGEVKTDKNLTMGALTKLDFWCKNGDASLTEETLKFVLSRSVALESLGLIRVDTLTDSVLLDVLNINPFAKLCQLSLHECNCITQASLSELLLSTRNQLEFVKLISCLQVTRSNHDVWKQAAKKDNLHVQIEWK